jgi:excisionase family DNA binding protein
LIDEFGRERNPVPCASRPFVEAKITVAILREVLTVREVALELRCSQPHVYNVINGKVKNVPRLPTIAIGRRKKLIQRDTLEEWKKSNERGDDDVMIPPTKIDAVRRMEEDLYA